jgi:hypothetical protein
MKARHFLVAALLGAASFAVQAADKVKVGFVSTLSGPNARSASTSATASTSG